MRNQIVGNSGNTAEVNPDGSQLMQLTGRNVTEPFSGSATVTHTFAKAVNGFVISNDGASSLTFTIGTATITVNAGEVFEGYFSPFTQVTVTTTVAFRAYGLGA